jgi:hypothetical protein
MLLVEFPARKGKGAGQVYFLSNHPFPPPANTKSTVILEPAIYPVPHLFHPLPTGGKWLQQMSKQNPFREIWPRKSLLWPLPFFFTPFSQFCQLL